MAESGAPSIGNYKGVMLCNRPFAGTKAGATRAGAAAAGGLAGKAPFRAGGNLVTNKELGLNPAKRPIQHEKRKKKETVIQKHKKWLKQLQKEKRELEEEILAKEEKKQARKKAFARREKEMRDLIRGTEVNPESSSFEVSNSEDDEKISDLADELDKAIAKQTQSQLSAKQKKKLDDSKGKRPAWAYAEGKQEEELEELKEEELEDLLKFTQELDFEKYVEDMEVKTALENLKKRIDFLEPAEGEDIGDALERAIEEKLAARRAARTGEGGRITLSKEALDEWNTRNTPADNDEEKKMEEDDAVSVIQSIMSDSKSIRSIHSARSINALRNRIKKLKREEMKKKKGNLDTIQEGIQDLPEYKEPKMSKIVAVDRKSHQKEPSRLPYINRNPAI
eukprot:g4123.t1